MFKGQLPDHIFESHPLIGRFYLFLLPSPVFGGQLPAHRFESHPLTGPCLPLQSKARGKARPDQCRIHAGTQRSGSQGGRMPCRFTLVIIFATSSFPNVFWRQNLTNAVHIFSGIVVVPYPSHAMFSQPTQPTTMAIPPQLSAFLLFFQICPRQYPSFLVC